MPVAAAQTRLLDEIETCRSCHGRLRVIASMHLTAKHYRGNVPHMPIAESKVTAQGQISVPAEVRKELGVGPGSVLEWDKQDDLVIVRRAGKFSSTDVHDAIFSHGHRKSGSPANVKDGIRKYIRKRHARD